MAFYVYLLRCSDGSYYVGHTDDIETRMAQHQSAAVRSYTSTRLPVELLKSESFVTREEALTAEQQLKGWSRKKKEAWLAGDFEELRRLGKKTFN
ncbi:GIY-YIG nuclease family protein [Herbaspirillum sp.]|uniref:GIY-YIG nuclease family protein n=1 Tax=Herbaspirillum sp. TaxID=1890675 RepID=UPI001B2803ED|nr:GIY-YIG nuclease family protein [Herbaspirillum sp.]MBO9536942.1 GIY-YIG nuclease family protein [Herbaspirillum sp.]